MFSWSPRSSLNSFTCFKKGKKSKESAIGIDSFHSPTCSYDLRSHAPGDKCPECGTPIPNHPAPPAKPA